MTTCASCGKPMPDQAVICHLCTGRLRRDLLDIPALLDELETTALRQAKTGDGGGPGDAAPWDERARRAQHLIRNAVSTWCRILWEEACAPDVGLDLALWLADQTGRIRMQPWAADCRNGIRGVMAAGWRAIDRPGKRWYAGPCSNQVDDTECGTILWAEIDHPDVACPRCGYRWPVAMRREWLLTAAVDVVETAATIAAALTLMARSRVSAAQIRKWHWRKRLKHAGQRGDGAWLYRVGDVLDLVEKRDAERSDPDQAHHFEHARFDHGQCDACPDDHGRDVGRCDWCGRWICEQHAGQQCPNPPTEDSDTPDATRELTSA